MVWGDGGKRAGGAACEGVCVGGGGVDGVGVGSEAVAGEVVGGGGSSGIKLEAEELEEPVGLEVTELDVGTGMSGHFQDAVPPLLW